VGSVKKLIYIAGPISSPEPLQFLHNVQTGIARGKELLMSGQHYVCIPHLDYSLFLVDGPSPDLEQIQCNSMRWNYDTTIRT
jgi:hypothetical protein